MKNNITKKRKHEDEKQSNSAVEVKEYIKFDDDDKFEGDFTGRINKWFTGRITENLLSSLRLNPHLKTLGISLEENDVPDTAVYLLLAGNNTLTTLHIESPYWGIIDQGFSALALNKSLTCFEIFSQNVTVAGLTQLLKNSVIKKLKLRLFGINEQKYEVKEGEGCDEMARILSQHPSLTELSLDFLGRRDGVKGMTPQGISHFLNNRVLNTLILCDNYDVLLGDKVASILSGHPTLTSLTLFSYGITPKGAAFFLNNKTLKHLNLDSNHLVGDEGACSLSVHPTLTSLSLKNCNLSDKGVTALAGNTCLIDLSLNEVSLWGAIALAFNQTLTKLVLSARVFTREPDISWIGWLFLFGNQTLRELIYAEEYYAKEEKGELSTRKREIKQNLSHYLPSVVDKEKGFLQNITLNLFGVRNPQLQSHYDKEVMKNLSELMPSVLAGVVQSYSKGEYPYRCQLFYNRLTLIEKHKIHRALPQLIKHFSDLEKGCKVW